MKKYVKPDVFYESFELSVGVAACSGIVIKNGTVKSYDKDDAGNQALEEMGFFGNSCTNVITADNVYNYFGAGEGFAFGS